MEVTCCWRWSGFVWCGCLEQDLLGFSVHLCGQHRCRDRRETGDDWGERCGCVQLREERRSCVSHRTIKPQQHRHYSPPFQSHSHTFRSEDPRWSVVSCSEAQTTGRSASQVPRSNSTETCLMNVVQGCQTPGTGATSGPSTPHIWPTDRVSLTGDKRD